MFDSLKAITVVQKIKNGGTASLSKSQIVSIIINLSDASKNLSPDIFTKLERLYQQLRKDKLKTTMDYKLYIETCSQIISEFEKIAPFELYNGDDSIAISKESEEKKKKRLVLNSINTSIQQLKQMYANAVRNLGESTVEDVIAMFDCNEITQTQKEEFINSIECLQVTIQMTPTTIEKLEEQKRAVQEEINNL
jgi:hypothetical protein